MDFVTRIPFWPSTLLLFAACADPSPSPSASEGSSTDPGESSAGPASTVGTTHGSEDPSAGSGSESHGESHGESTDDTGGPPTGDPDDPELPFDPDQLAEVCARGNGDPIALALCTDPAPTIDELGDLYAALGLQVSPAQYAVLSNTTSLAARSVSVINPRVLLLAPFEVGTAVATFSRGEQVVELVGYDAAADALNFYLFTFFRPCNDDDAGCSLAELFTPAIESGWTKWSLYQDVDLENHTLDCLTCHQPGGPGTEKLLLAHQSTEPWLHWFPSIGLGTGVDTQSSVELTPRFLEMHAGDGQYGGIPIEMLTPPNPSASGIVLQQMLELYWTNKGGPPAGLTHDGQPHDFDSAAIEADIAAGSTATWDAYYAQTLAGERMPVPYHHHDITDPELRATAVESYLAVAHGGDPATLVDPRAVLDETTEAELGFRPRAGASAEEILHHVCQRCHNDELDQTLTRARFNAERPAELTADQKTAALARLMAPEGSKLQMPPRRFATLPEAELQTLVEFLQQ